jgi:hypothetical protein
MQTSHRIEYTKLCTQAGRRSIRIHNDRDVETSPQAYLRFADGRVDRLDDIELCPLVLRWIRATKRDQSNEYVIGWHSPGSSDIGLSRERTEAFESLSSSVSVVIGRPGEVSMCMRGAGGGGG